MRYRASIKIDHAHAVFRHYMSRVCLAAIALLWRLLSRHFRLLHELFTPPAVILLRRIYGSFPRRPLVCPRCSLGIAFYRKLIDYLPKLFLLL